MNYTSNTIGHLTALAAATFLAGSAVAGPGPQLPTPDSSHHEAPAAPRNAPTIALTGHARPMAESAPAHPAPRLIEAAQGSVKIVW